MTIPCTECPETFPVSGEDPDATLSDLWAHLSRHATSREHHEALFVHCQERAR